MYGENDESNMHIAQGNCAYCAVGALLNQSATEVMRHVYGKMHALPPKGESKDNDGSDGFSDYYLYMSSRGPAPRVRGTGGYQRGRSLMMYEKPEKPTGTDALKAQIKGIKYFLSLEGYSTRSLKDKGEFEFLGLDDAVKAINREREGTKFLTLSGPDTWVDGIVTKPHWTVGQVENGTATFYDYQLNVTNPTVKEQLTDQLPRRKKYNNPYGNVRGTYDPPGPQGDKLDKRTARALIVVVEKDN